MAFLADEHVALRPVKESDLDQLADWRNEPELRTRTREWAPLSRADQKRWFDCVVSAPTRERKNFMFIAETSYTRPPGQTPNHSAAIGCVGLCHWDVRDRLAEISFYLGDKEARGKGHCKQALKLLIGWGFNELDLAKVYAESFSFNAPSIGILTKLGFVEEGRLREHVYRMGKRHDSVMLGLLRDEWKADG